MHDRRDRFQFEPTHRSHLFKEWNVAAAAVTKAPIFSNCDGVHLSSSEFIDEIASFHFGKRHVEMQRNQKLNTKVGHHSRLMFESF